MDIIARINIDIYSCVASDIVTDEVIVTDERIKHIKERHPNDYECFNQYLTEIIENPDYIIKDKKPNTAFILKEIDFENQKFELILKLQTSSENIGYKNSVITFLKISDRKFKQYLRNKQILYKRI